MILRFTTKKGKTLAYHASEYVAIYRQNIFTRTRVKDVRVGDCVPMQREPDARVPITEIEEMDPKTLPRSACYGLYL